MSLTPKQKRFVTEYLRTLNASEAARRAGYSKKTAYSIGHENLSKPEIKAAIDSVLDQEDVEAAWITRRMVAQAKGEIPTEVEHDGEGEVVKSRFKTHEALDKLARVKGLYQGEEDDRAVKVLIVRHPDEVDASEFHPEPRSSK